MEIYCERVKDLLNPKSKGNLRVRSEDIERVLRRLLCIIAIYMVYTTACMHFHPLHSTQRTSGPGPIRGEPGQTGRDLIPGHQVSHGGGKQSQVMAGLIPRLGSLKGQCYSLLYTNSWYPKRAGEGSYQFQEVPILCAFVRYTHVHACTCM